MEPTTRKERLQLLGNRWLTEPLLVEFPSFGIEMPNPTTCAEYVVSDRIVTADKSTNIKHFGVEDPKAVLAALGTQIESAITGQVDPKILKDAAVVLDVFKADSEKLAESFGSKSVRRDDLLHASYSADAKAAAKCLSIVTALTNELGISLPVRGSRRKPG